jgi:hypothetical protein
MKLILMSLDSRQVVLNKCVSKSFISFVFFLNHLHPPCICPLNQRERRLCIGISYLFIQLQFVSLLRTKYHFTVDARCKIRCIFC